MTTTASAALRDSLPAPEIMGDRQVVYVTRAGFELFLAIEKAARGFAAATVVRVLRGEYAKHVYKHVMQDAHIASLFATAAACRGDAMEDVLARDVFANLAKRFVRSSAKRKMEALRASMSGRAKSSVSVTLKSKYTHIY